MEKQPLRAWKKVVLGAGTIFVMLLTVLLARALMSSSPQVTPAPFQPPEIDKNRAARVLSRAIQFKTISHENPSETDADNFAKASTGLRDHLESSFPLAHKHLQREIVSQHSLLYTWKGSNPEAEPILFAAHLDVVPIEPGTENLWEKPPFSGEISDGYIWGRGTMDDKFSATAILEATEALLQNGFTPKRTVYFAFGHDEEVSGKQGAGAIAALLQKRDVRLSYVLDEGLMITEGLVPGVNPPTALVGIANKGYLSLELLVETEGGHSSTPPQETSVGILSNAIVRLENQQMPARLDGAALQMFKTLGPEMPFGEKMIFANLWFFRSLVTEILQGKPSTNALVRTTTAPTMLEASVKENVLSARARAVINFRILPGDSIQSVQEHVRTTIDDPRVKLTPLEGLRNNPSGVSSPEAPEFKNVEKTLREVFPDTLVTPSLFIAIGDARYYEGLTDNLYRFTPQHIKPEDRPRFHGTNERIAVDDYMGCIAFYLRLLQNTAGSP